MDKPNWIAIAGILVTGVGLIVGIIGWWISKFLADKKDIITCMIKIENLEREMEEVKEEQKNIRRHH